MAVGSAYVDAGQSLAETVSSAVQSTMNLSNSMDSSAPSTVVLANMTAVDDPTVHWSWFGLLGRMTLFLIKVIPGILYWLMTFTTITMPTVLFTLFSTSLTFTMNATTL